MRQEDLPASTAAKEKYFMEQAGLGEQLCVQGVSLYRILRVSPYVIAQVLRSPSLPRWLSSGLYVSTHHPLSF